ncbi:AAA ATPase-like protein [Rhodococcus sp. SMB37]|uniref:helix-turn-helix transcriptional regulator n=1 Tax=Rhodococcus sp. SMB37 TaxID=2512213 RepID=UPI0010E3C8FD|nr:LuxR family transcriptional regulator [Rhodococcus sp. SMB37]TCN42241.1 AAA ATPase-like protein [Rhodococcus sp. SMB37]
MLVGRETELSQLDRLLDGARAGSPVLALVEGPPGIGKSALVRAFTSRHRDIHAQFASGAPWESDHPWAVLEQLTHAPEPGADPIDAAHAYLDAIHSTTIIVVDDAHWSDIESLQSLSSMIRRAHQRPILMLWVIPDVLPDGIDDATARILSSHRADTIHVRALTSGDVAQLALLRAGVDLSPWTAQRLHEHTLGSPRPVLQLLDEIPRAQWQRWQARFPAPAQHAAAVRRALTACSSDTRALIEAAAILGTGSPLAPAAALAEVDDPTPLLDEAHTAGLLTMRERQGIVTLLFPDPMTSAAVTDEIGPARWRELHARAATLVDDEGDALFHLVSATPAADGTLADKLDRFARQRAADGAWAQAAEALITAGRITPERDLRTQRLIRGVDALTGAADLPQAQTFVPEIESAPGGPMRNAVLGYLAIQRGRAAEAHYLLSEAWTMVDESETDPELAAMICQRMVLHSLARMRGDELVAWADRASSLVRGDAPAVVESNAIRGLGLGMTGRIDEARASYAGLADHVRLGAQSQRIRMAEGWLALALDAPDRARTELEASEPTTFRGGSLRISLWAQAWLARTQFTLGAWSDALRTVDRAAAQLDSTGLDLLRPLVHWTGAQVHALRGNWDAAREHLRHGRAGSNDYTLMLVPSCISAAQCAEVAADYDGVLRQLDPLVTLRHREALDEPGFWPWPDLYGNALVMTGRVDDADAFLRPHEERAAERGHRSAKARLGYVRGRIHGARGDIDAARDSFESALSEIATLPLPYDRARINLAYGQTLRRAGRRRDADSVIRTARELYAVLGAGSIVARCDRELKAGGLKSGDAVTTRNHTDVSTLTPQERAVATLVAAGHTNKEVAGELFLSVKTVQYHLTRVYAKFGIRSRSELAARFRQEE